MTPPPEGPRSLAREPAPLAGLIAAVLRRPGVLIGFPAAGFVLGILLVLLVRTHRGDAWFSPQNPNQAAQGLSGLASQLGLPLGMMGNTETPDFYRALLRSRDLMEDVVRTEYRFAQTRGGTDSMMGTLTDLYRIKGRTPGEREIKAIRRLRSNTSLGVERQANMVSVRVKAKWPELAEMVAQRYVDLVNRFNQDKRRSRAAAERAFTEARLEELRGELEAAEADLRRFLERNRVYQGDPALVNEYQRLSRQVAQVQQSHQTVATAYEQARVEEVRTTPVITVVQTSVGTAQPSIRLRLGAMMGFFLGGIIALTYVLVKEYAARERALAPEAYQELDALTHRAVQRLVPARRASGNDRG